MTKSNKSPRYEYQRRWRIMRKIQRDNARHVAGLVAGLKEYCRLKGIRYERITQ